MKPEEARREKLRKIRELGYDPWGQRFDGHQSIGAIRAARAEITVEPAAARRRRGRPRAGPPEPVQHGPRVRAAGRIVLERKKGKLIFIDIRDWTGQIQLLVGRNQVGEENWALAECLDLGDLIGVDGELKRTRTGELTIFAEKLHFLTKTLDPPPEKHHGLTDPEMRQRMRHLDLTYGEGVLRAVPAAHARSCNRSARRWPARGLSKSKGRRCTRSPAAPRPGRSRRITTRSTCRCFCGSPWSCI